jgi:hypothetical protein
MKMTLGDVWIHRSQCQKCLFNGVEIVSIIKINRPAAPGGMVFNLLLKDDSIYFSLPMTKEVEVWQELHGLEAMAL